MSDQLPTPEEFIRCLLEYGVTEADMQHILQDPNARRTIEETIFRCRYGAKDPSEGPEPWNAGKWAYNRKAKWSLVLRREDFRGWTYGNLWRDGIRTLGVLQMMTAERLLEIHNFGTTMLDEVTDYLEVDGLRLREADEPLDKRARAVFGQVSNIPTSYLQARGVIEADKLTRRGIYQVVQLAQVPRTRLLQIRNPWHTVTEEAVEALELELGYLGISLLPE